MTKTRCEICDRNFKNEEALEMHNQSKHKQSIEKPKKVNTKKLRNWFIGVIVVGLILAFVIWSFSSLANERNSCQTSLASEINIGGHSNLALHIHANLRIILDGEEQIIPPNIGISNNIMRPVHTHDSSGQLHIEGPCVRDFTLGDFFDIWNKPFSQNQVLDKTSSEGKITVKVNGLENNDYQNLILRDGQKIVVEFNSF